MPAVLKAAVMPEQIAVVAILEIGAHAQEVVSPHLGQVRVLGAAFAREFVAILRRVLDSLIQIVQELVGEIRVRELLAQDRRQAHGDLGRDPLGHQAVEGAEQGKVALGRALEQHVGAVRPSAVGKHVG